MLRRILIISFLVLIVSIFIVFWFKKGMRFLPDPNKNTTKQPAMFSLPIPLDNPRIESLFVHYFLGGEIEGLVPQDNNLIIQFKSAEVQIPEIVVTNETRVWRISPPYTEASSVRLNKSNLKVGQIIDISIEYDLRASNWNVRDVFIPTDRN